MKTQAIILYCLFICFSKFIFGQNDSVHKINYSLAGGYGISYLSNKLVPPRSNTEYNINVQHSFAFGAELLYRFSPKFSVSLEANFSAINSLWYYYFYHSTTGVLNSTYRTYIKSQHLSFPLLFTYSLNKASISFGPQYSVLLSEKGKLRLAYPNTGYDTTMNVIGDILIKSNLCLYGRISYPLFRKLSIEANYCHGLLEVTDFDAGWVNESKTRQLLLGVRYYFR